MSTLSKTTVSLTQSVPTVTPEDLRLKHPVPLPRNLSKAQFSVKQNVLGLFKKAPVENVIMLTLTHPTPMTIAAAGRCRNSLLTNAIRGRYNGYLWVMEPKPTGRIHYHILLPVTFDAHHRTDVDAWKPHMGRTRRQRFNAMNAALRAEAAFWQTKARCFGFGIHEVAPIYSSPEAVAKYLSKSGSGKSGPSHSRSESASPASVQTSDRLLPASGGSVDAVRYTGPTHVCSPPRSTPRPPHNSRKSSVALGLTALSRKDLAQ